MMKKSKKSGKAKKAHKSQKTKARTHKKAKPKKVAKPKPRERKAPVPKTWAGMLSIKEGAVVVCLHCKEQFFTRLRNQLPKFARAFLLISDDRQPTVIIRFFNEHADFETSFRWLGKKLAVGGIIWGVLNKKVISGRDLRKEMVAAAKREGYVEVRKMEFSNVEIGTLFRRKKE